MIAKRIAKEIDITFEMRRYNKYPEATGMLTSLNYFCPQRLELDLTHRLTFCNATSYTDMDGETVSTTGGDGLAIVSTVHTLSATSGVTWSNSITAAAFSQTSLEAAELLATTDIRSNYNEKRTMDFNTIITSDNPSTVRAVRQVLESTADVDSANSGVTNVSRGRYRHVVLPNLATTATGANDTTKKQWWFLASTGLGILGWQAYLGIFEAPNLKKPDEGNNGEDVHNDNWTYGCRMSYGIVTLSGRGLIASLI